MCAKINKEAYIRACKKYPDNIAESDIVHSLRMGYQVASVEYKEDSEVAFKRFIKRHFPTVSEGSLQEYWNEYWSDVNDRINRYESLSH